MPYTPPSQRSPATSKTNSPILSRSHSYVEQPQPAHPAPQVQRPTLPRSVSSASYLSKNRRSPSFSTVDNTAANSQSTAGNVDYSSDARGTRTNGSLRQSPHPLNDLLIPSGAITTPPDSSDDEERGRDIGNLQQLQDALLHINVKRAPSPNGKEVTAPQSKLPQLMTAARSLSAEARKISHSRSSSDVMLSKHMIHPIHSDPVISSSDGSDAEDDELLMKPPLLRKKSGELVKPALRPPSRRRPSSMPGTPTYSKAVHFNEDMEQVRHFLHSERPIAVSAGSSPVETYDSESEYPFREDLPSKTPEWDIKLANFPVHETFERQTAPVRVERIFLASDNQTLVGNIACANLSFHKTVVARFTLDYWKTTSEVVAEFNHDVRKKQKEDGYDRFNFNIKLVDQANLESKTLLLCVRYQVGGQEFWDNNNSMNYQVDFVKKAKKQRENKRPTAGLGAIPRSRQSPLVPRPKSVPAASFDDDFGQDFENKFHFGGRGMLADSPNTSIKLKPRSKRGSLFPDQAKQSHAGQAFSARYDFGASLTAALSTAQTALGDRSGLKINTPDKGRNGYFDHPAPLAKAKATDDGVPGTRPDSLTLEKPDLQSAEYNELIQKFCFFGTPSGKISPNAPFSPAVQPAHGDAAMDTVSYESSGSNHSSATSSPPSPAMALFVDGANDAVVSRSPSPLLSRSSSPGHITGSGPEDRFGPQYQYGYGMLAGMFIERSHTPQACV